MVDLVTETASGVVGVDTAHALQRLIQSVEAVPPERKPDQEELQLVVVEAVHHAPGPVRNHARAVAANYHSGLALVDAQIPQKNLEEKARVCVLAMSSQTQRMVDQDVMGSHSMHKAFRKIGLSVLTVNGTGVTGLPVTEQRGRGLL